MSVLLGKKGFAEIFITDSWFPIFCFKRCLLRVEVEPIEKTSIASGRDREFTTGLTSGRFSVFGVTELDNLDGNISIMYFLQNLSSVHSLRINMTDQDGTSKEITFDAIVNISELDINITEWSQSVLDFIITGEVDYGDLQSPPTPETETVYSAWWQTINGQNYIDGASTTQNSEATPYTLGTSDRVLEVYVEGDAKYYRATTPVDSRDYRFIPATNRIEFLNDLVFDGNQRVLVIFERTL